MYRIGTPINMGLIVSLTVLNASKFVVWESVYSDNRDINTASVHVVWNSISLVIALVVSFAFEGRQVAQRIFIWQLYWRFMFISLLFTVASYLIISAVQMGVSPAVVATLGYLYLPIAALLSVLNFPRRYGLLEWLALGIMTLGTSSFVLLRERGKWLSEIAPVQVGSHVLGDTRVGNGEVTTTTLRHADKSYFDFLQVEGTGMVLSAASISALASVLAERIYKGQEDIEYHEGVELDTYDNFYVMKVHIDF